jgi:hypothetical protein
VSAGEQAGSGWPGGTVAAVRPGFDPAMAGRHAECDGGGLLAGAGGHAYAARMEFVGTLTGEYVDHGDPAWRWYLLTHLVRKPDGWLDDAVWCESNSLFLAEEPPCAS